VSTPPRGHVTPSAPSSWGAGPRARSSRRCVRSFWGAVINLGYPWWLLAVVLVAFVLLLYRALRGRFSRWPLAGLATVLSPVCTLAAVAAGLTLCVMLSPPLRGSRRTFQRVRPTRPSEARHNAIDHQSPDGGPLRNPDRLALSLFVLLIHAVVFGFPVPLNGVSRTTRSMAKMRARRMMPPARAGVASGAIVGKTTSCVPLG